MIEFFWDVASPYTYLATTQVPALEKRLGQKIKYRPTLVGGIYKNTVRALTMFALANLYMARRRLLPPQASCAL